MWLLPTFLEGTSKVMPGCLKLGIFWFKSLPRVLDAIATSLDLAFGGLFQDYLPTNT